ncbi:MAG TPA: FtsX-like permease family protein [Steroidobacteraceae bacterium]|nr:FtsX-like permease family protein [Steroidobacteraceae bacterium]
MKYLPLIWLGIWRKPVRTTLILLQVAVAFALFGVLQGMKTGVNRVAADLAANILLVRSSLDSASSLLPATYADRLRSIPGIKTVAFLNAFGATYQRSNQQVSVIGLEKSDAWRTLLPYFVTMRPKDLQALQATRTGVLITPYAARKYGWHIGDRIPLMSSTLQNNGSGTWIFDVVGMANPGLKISTNVFANYDYLDAARAMHKGTVAQFFVAVSDPTQATAVSAAIDRVFANSASETTTQPVSVFMQQQLGKIGNLNFVIRSVVSAVLVALMFSIATMMMQTVRERTPELGVMKTVGFGDLAVFLLVVVETLLVCVAGALIGLGLATSIFPVAARFLPGLSMPGVVLGLGMLGAVLISLISVALPASRAARLQVVAALVRR